MKQLHIHSDPCWGEGEVQKMKTGVGGSYQAIVGGSFQANVLIVNFSNQDFSFPSFFNSIRRELGLFFPHENLPNIKTLVKDVDV